MFTEYAKFLAPADDELAEIVYTTFDFVEYLDNGIEVSCEVEVAHDPNLDHFEVVEVIYFAYSEEFNTDVVLSVEAYTEIVNRVTDDKVLFERLHAANIK